MRKNRCEIKKEVDIIRHIMKINGWRLRHIAAIAKCSVPQASRYMRCITEIPTKRRTFLINAAIAETQARLARLLSA